jgi:hypothetical protein
MRYPSVAELGHPELPRSSADITDHGSTQGQAHSPDRGSGSAPSRFRIGDYLSPQLSCSSQNQSRGENQHPYTPSVGTLEGVTVTMTRTSFVEKSPGSIAAHISEVVPAKRQPNTRLEEYLWERPNVLFPKGCYIKVRPPVPAWCVRV